MKNLALLFLLLICLSLNIGCAQSKKTIIFKYDEYKKIDRINDHKDTCIAFINEILSGDYERSQELRPDMFLLDVSAGMIEMENKEPFLAGLGEYLDDYSKNSYDLLALGVFLREKYNARKDLYDKILRGSLRLDINNLSAIFLLAKLRYENNIKNDAHYLIQYLWSIDKSSEKISNMYNSFQGNYGDLEGDLPDLSEFIRYDVYYYEED